MPKDWRGGIPAVFSYAAVALLIAVGFSSMPASANGVGTVFVFNPVGITTILEHVSYSVVAEANVGAEAKSVAFSPDSNLAYIPSASEGALAVIDRNLYAVVSRIPVGTAPQRIAVAPTGQRAYVTDSTAAALLVVDLVQGNVQARFALDGPGDGVAVTPDDRRVYVSVPSSATLASLDPQSGQIITRISVGTGATRITLTPDGGWLYVLRPDAGSVVVVDPRIDEVTTTVAVGAGPTDIAATPDSRQVLVAGPPPSQLTTIDVGPHRLGPRFGVPSAAPATGVAADRDALYLTTPAANRLWVLDRAGKLKEKGEVTIAGATSVATVPEPFTIRVVPRELPNTGSGPTSGPSLYLWVALIVWAAVAAAIGLAVRRSKA